MGKITLYTETVIDSCHHLEDYEGKCRNLHGHTWVVQVWIQGTDEDKDQVGIMFDFGNLKDIKEYMDHKYINELEEFKVMNPTAENISGVVLDKLSASYSNLGFRVRIYETKIGKETYAQRQTSNFDINLL